MGVLLDHSAPGQALGYYFQLERALSWLTLAGAGSYVGIETEDDIVVALASGEKILEQDKSSTEVYPFSPSKLDLWKTLEIWLEATKADEIDLDTTTLYLVTNKTKLGSLAEEIGNADSEEDIEKCLINLRKAGENPSDTIRQKVENVLNNSDELLKKIIGRIKYQDGVSVYGVELRKQLVNNLQLDSDDEPETIIDELVGWTFNLVVNEWRAKRPAIIERDAFIRKKNNCIKNKIEKMFSENAIEISKITTKDEESELDSNFVNQLRIINSSQEEIIEAIRDYLSSTIKKTEISKKGYLTATDFKNTEKGLTRRWKMIFEKLKTKNLKEGHTLEDLGKLIYYDTMDHNAKIGAFQTTNYFLTNGIYHSLAEVLTVGWHPEFQEKMHQYKKTVIK